VRNQTDPIPYTVNTPLFGVNANPTSVNAAAGTSTGTSRITVTSMNGFTGTITLAAKGPIGFSCSFNPATVTGTATSTMTCGGAIPGANGVTVNATATSPPPGSITVFHQKGLIYTLSGIVCLTDPGAVARNTACPPSQTAFTGMNSRVVGTQLRVAVALNESVGVLGFDVTLWADHTILQPFDADITRTVLTGSVTVLAKCIGGVLVQGSTCVPTDNLDTIHLAAASNLLTQSPINGTLFTAVYNIVANNTAPINVGFQKGCGNVVIPTSVPPLCVSLTNGGGGSVPEFAALNATYSTLNTVQTFGIKTSQTFTFRGTTPPAQTANVYLTEINGFSCFTLSCVDLSTLTPPATPSNPPRVSLTPTSVSDPNIQNSTLRVSISRTTQAGIYIIYLVAGPDTTNTPFPGTTYLGAVVTLTVIVIGDFSITASPSPMSVNAGGSATSTITLKSLNSFAGVISLTTAINATGASATASPTSITMTSGATLTATLTVSLPSGTTHNSNVNVTAVSLGITHILTIIVTPGAPPNISVVSVTISTGTSATIGDTVTIGVKLQNSGSTPGTFQLSVSYGGVTVGTPINVTLAMRTQTYNFTWNTAGYAAGSQTINVVISSIPQGNIPSGQTGTFSPTNFTLNAPPPSPFSGNTLIYIIAGILAAIVIASVLLLLRRRGARKTATLP
jgi:hypothetical protein